MATKEGYGWIDYLLDVNLVRRFMAFKERYAMDTTRPWEEDALYLLRTKRERIRTGEGNITSGDHASFSEILSGEVTGAQAYAVLVKEINAAVKRTQEFRTRHANITKDSPLEQIANAIHIAEIEGQPERAAKLTYTLGNLLVMMNRGDLEKANRTVGYSLVEKAYCSVKPRML